MVICLTNHAFWIWGYMQLWYSLGVGSVVMLVADMVVGLKHVHIGIWGYMHLGHSIGVGGVCRLVFDME